MALDPRLAARGIIERNGAILIPRNLVQQQTENGQPDISRVLEDGSLGQYGGIWGFQPGDMSQVPGAYYVSGQEGWGDGWYIDQQSTNPETGEPTTIRQPIETGTSPTLEGDYYRLPMGYQPFSSANAAPENTQHGLGFLAEGVNEFMSMPPVQAAMLFAGGNALSGGSLTAPGASTASLGELAGNFASGVGNTVASLPTTLSNAVSNVGNTISNAGTSLSNLLSGTPSADTSLAEFLGADASQLAGQGVQGTQLETLLGQSGADAFTAADLAQLTGQGITNANQLSGLGNQAMQTVPQALGGATLGTGPVAAAAGGAAGTGAAGTGATTLSQLLGVTGGAATTLDALGKAIPGLIGAYAASEQGDAYGDLINADNARYQSNLALGAPSRSRYEASFAPGFDISQDPALKGAMDTTMSSLLRGLSTQGNPFGNPGGLAEANKYVMGNVALPYLNQYRNQNASTGGYGAFNTAAGQGPNTNLAGAGINADAGVWGGLGGAAADVFTPRTSLSDLLKGIKGVLA